LTLAGIATVRRKPGGLLHCVPSSAAVSNALRSPASSGRERFTATTGGKKMTQFISQEDLERLSVTELRWKLREAFNALAGMPKNSPECADTVAAIGEIEKVLRRKMTGPKP
jgi:hypothetical protein